LVCFVISIISLTVFITHELTTEHPLLNLRLLSNYNFGFSNLIIFIFSMGMFGSTFLMPLYLQNSLGYTALQAGSVFLPVGIIQGIMSPVSGFFSSKINPKIPMILGMCLLAFSFYINSQLSFLTEHNYIMASLYIRGFAMGTLFTPLSVMSLLTIKREQMAQASAITNTIRQIAGSIGVALFTTLLTSRINFHMQTFGNAIQSGTQEFRNEISNLSYYIQAHGGSTMSTAIKQGQSLMISNVSKQAYIQGIDDDFLIAALITALGLIPTIILRSRRNTTQTKNV